MPISATTVTHGPAAFDALAAAVRAAKGGEALTPVAVIVPTNTAGVMARRALGRRGGAVAVDVLTLYRVAELLGAPSLVAEGRTPVSTPVVDLAVKEVLRAVPGLYRDVADHPSTVVALRDLYREVRLAGWTAATALGRRPRGREPARIVAEVARRLAVDWYDEGDLLERAAAEAATSRHGRFRRVVVHGPERLRPLERALLRALGDAGTVELLVARTGDDDADAAVVDLVRELTGAEPPAFLAPRLLGAVRVVSTTDADDEIRVAVRAVLDGARAGTRFDRMAVLFPTERPYARLVEHHLAAAGLPWNGRPGTTVDERMVPRVLAELLDLDRRGVRRLDLMALLGDVPALGADGHLVPAARWERIGREAGVVREADWERRLPRWIAEERRRAAEGEEQAWRRARADDAEALADFVRALREALGPPHTTRSWAGWVRWCHERLDAWFGARLHRLDGDERIAWEQTQRVLDRLGHLDGIGGPVTRGEFRTTFVAELDLVPARRGTIGDGVHVGTLAGARGLDLDLAVVVGGADGLLPPPPTTDPLLGDEDRVAAGLVGSDERVRNAHRQFLAVVGATPAVTIVAPRGDLRATAVHHRSRWVTPLLEGLAGGEVVVDSHAQGLAATEFPRSAAEHRLRELWVSARSGSDIRDHPLVAGDVVLERALALRDGRAADVVTVYDGDLTSRAVPAFDRPIAPTRIEAWAACPHAYFVRYVLGVSPVDEPAELLDLSPLDRGSAIHAAIDALQREVLEGRLPAPGDDGWTDAHAAALRGFLDGICDELEHGGRTGRAAYWATSRQALAAELDGWVGAERERWERRRLIASEHRFGDDAAVTLALADGRPIAFRGSIDRVDRLPDGTLVVTDHKTGSLSKRYKDLKDDPTAHGVLFQLPVYAAAARALDGRADALVRAEYAFFAKARYERLAVVFDETAWKLALARLADVVDGIEARLFPAAAEPPGWRHYIACKYCEPDELGTTERFPEWERKRHDPRLARWFGDGDGDAEDGDG